MFPFPVTACFEDADNEAAAGNFDRRAFTFGEHGALFASALLWRRLLKSSCMAPGAFVRGSTVALVKQFDRNALSDDASEFALRKTAFCEGVSW